MVYLKNGRLSVVTVLCRTCTSNYTVNTYSETPDKAVGVILDVCSINCSCMCLEEFDTRRMGWSLAHELSAELLRNYGAGPSDPSRSADPMSLVSDFVDHSCW